MPPPPPKICFRTLSANPREQGKLREYLRTTQNQLERCIEDGTQPKFGYPIVLFDKNKQATPAINGRQGYNVMWKTLSSYICNNNRQAVTIKEMVDSVQD